MPAPLAASPARPTAPTADRRPPDGSASGPDRVPTDAHHAAKLPHRAAEIPDRAPGGPHRAGRDPDREPNGPHRAAPRPDRLPTGPDREDAAAAPDRTPAVRYVIEIPYIPPHDPATAPALISPIPRRVMEPTPDPRSENDQQLAADLTHMEQVLTAAREDAEAQSHLEPVGFGPEALDEILALVDSARTAYKARGTAMGAEDAASEAKTSAFDSAQSSYAAFRVIARARLSEDDDAQTALKLRGRVPDALDPFVSHAKAGYAAAKDEPYQSKLAVRGYTPDRLDALLDEVQALLDADRAFTDAEGRAKRATAARDEEARAARRDYAEFRDTARRVLPPDLRDRIGLG